MLRNLPNLITGARLFLAVCLFVVLSMVHHGRGGQSEFATLLSGHERLLFNVCLAIFSLAALSDVLDGHIARRWGLQTDFGRIVDPFADKVIVCGAFVELLGLPESQVVAWMVVVILARELLVDGLRGFAESKGIAFPASWAGKAKMLIQCACLIWIFFALANLRGVAWAPQVTAACVWTAVVATVASGVIYLHRARKVLSAELLATHTQGGEAP